MEGRWDWQRGRWVWVAGRWQRPEPGKRWQPGRWEQRGDRWRMPGKEAQYRMAPRPRPGSERWDAPPGNARVGAVMALFYPHQGALTLPLILRAPYDGAHRGQISFPGGGMEAMA